MQTFKGLFKVVDAIHGTKNCPRFRKADALSDFCQAFKNVVSACKESMYG